MRSGAVHLANLAMVIETLLGRRMLIEHLLNPEQLVYPSFRHDVDPPDGITPFDFTGP